MDEFLENEISQPAKCLKPGEIRVYHPGYDDKQPLLTFLGFDTENGGLWREVVTTACGIITNNQFNGILKSKDGPATEEILSPGDYYWHLPDPKYAIIPTFRDWQFPVEIPEIWRTKSWGESKYCALSKQRYGLQKAHIIPRGETEWFGTNRMGYLYSQDNLGNSVDDEDNIITMRADLHIGFDQKLWTFFPKKDVVIHSMSRDASIHNNVPLKVDVCREFLLARFAWSLYPMALEPWLMMKKARKLWIEEEGDLVEKETSGADCLAMAHALKPRSTSPKKRKIDQIIPLPLNPKDDTDSGLGSTDDDDSKLDLNDQWEENNRGRKRLRGDR